MDKKEKFVELVDFASHAYVGAQISLFRDCGLPYDCIDPKSLKVKEVSLGKYLNHCWKSLIVKDDPHLIETFIAIQKKLPNESPLCIIKTIYKVGLEIFANPPIIGSSSSKSKRSHKNRAFVDTLSQMLYRIYKDECFTQFSKIIDENHRCDNQNPSFDSLSSFDPDVRIFDYPTDYLDFLILS